MLKSSLSNLAIVVLFSILFFVLITQRMMTGDNEPTFDQPGIKLNGSFDNAFLLSKLRFSGRNNSKEYSGELSVNPSIGVRKGTVPTIIAPVTMDTSALNNTIASRTFGSGDTKSSSLPSKNITPLFRDSNIKVVTVEESQTNATTKHVVKPKSNDFVEFLFPENKAKVVSNELKFLDSGSLPTPPHAPRSPRFGSDISPAAQSNLINCQNQSRCIVPELQLQRKYKIYFCSHPRGSGGVRFFYIAREGFLLHPNVEMLPQSRMREADYVVYLPGSAAWHRTECNDTTLAKRLIVLDEFDGHTLVAPTVGSSSEYARLYGSVAAPWYYTYFKRSFVRRSDGKFEGYPHLKQIDTYPLTYSVAEAYIRHSFKGMSDRTTDLWCTLRGHETMMTRTRVSTWVAEYVKSRSLKKVVTQNLNTDSRTVISKIYFESMYDSQILVTVNPMMWEGDFRLWEAMGTGALVFVDPVFVPHPFPLISGEHVIYFSNTNKTELFAKLDYYRQNKEEARRIAINGYLHAMKYHRTVNMIDYILRTTHLKEAKESGSLKLPQYSYTGQYLNSEAKKQLDTIKECQYPGIYDDPIAKSHRNVSAMSQAAAREHASRLTCRAAPTKANTNIQFLHEDKPKLSAESLVKVVKRTTKQVGKTETIVAEKPKSSADSLVKVVKRTTKGGVSGKDKEADRIHFLDTSKPKNQELEFLDTVSSTAPHAPISPRFGSDISPAAQRSLIECHNQSRCIVPELQLQRKYKIYFCSHPRGAGGVRFYYIAREGFLLHPNVEMLPQSRMDEADYVVYLPGSAAWHRTECNDTTLAKRLIVLDEFDGHTLIAPTVGNSSEYARLYGSVAAPWYYTYFKRSFVRRSDGKFEGYPHLKQIDTYPLTYSVAEAYIRHSFKGMSDRTTDLWCTLRGHESMKTRLRVQSWFAEYVQSRNVPKAITENLDPTATRNAISKPYFESMYDSQILVTVNPMMWEGDFRLWEAMGTGALVFVDPVFVPHPFPLISGEHVIYFSNTNKTELFAKLDYYRQNKEEARRIAINGYLHAMKYHRTVNMIDYILRTVHTKEALAAKASRLPQYSYTGQYLNSEAKKQLDTIKECQYPGIYDDPIAKSHRNVSAMSQAAAREHASRLRCPAAQRLNTNIEFMRL